MASVPMYRDQSRAHSIDQLVELCIRHIAAALSQSKHAGNKYCLRRIYVRRWETAHFLLVPKTKPPLEVRPVAHTRSGPVPEQPKWRMAEIRLDEFEFAHHEQAGCWVPGANLDVHHVFPVEDTGSLESFPCPYLLGMGFDSHALSGI